MMISKIKNRKGAVDIVVILIGIIIFASISMYCFKSLGKSVGTGAKNTEQTFTKMLK